jgi:hypothetical protein
VSEWSLIFFVYLGIKATASTRPRSSEEPESVQQAQKILDSPGKILFAFSIKMPGQSH